MKDLVSLILPKLKVKEIDVLKEEYKKTLEEGELYRKKCEIFESIRSAIRKGDSQLGWVRFFNYSIYYKSGNKENPIKENEILFHEDEQKWYIAKKSESPIIEYLTKDLDLKFTSVAVVLDGMYVQQIERQLCLSWEHWENNNSSNF